MRAVLARAIIVSLALAGAAGAQESPKTEVPKSKAPAGEAAPKLQAPAAQAGNAGVPDNLKLLILIRTSLIALNQADLTGNYSVLRDIAAPGFQQASDPAKLAQVFADLRNRKIDLSPIAVVPPTLTQPAAVTGQGLLRITGFFPTKPEQVNFDLLFQHIGVQWRLFGISVKTSPAPP
jgi:hypothetical protein